MFIPFSYVISLMMPELVVKLDLWLGGNCVIKIMYCIVLMTQFFLVNLHVRVAKQRRLVSSVAKRISMVLVCFK